MFIVPACTATIRFHRVSVHATIRVHCVAGTVLGTAHNNPPPAHGTRTHVLAYHSYLV
ncbi:hypothetical protein BC826DRAFT_1083490, partial [Russula brevipes]